MNPKSRRYSLPARVFGLGIFVLAAYAGCLDTPRTEPDNVGSSGASGRPVQAGGGKTGTSGGTSGATGNVTGGRGEDAQGGTSEGGTHAHSAGATSSGGEGGASGSTSGSTGGAVAFDGGAAGMMAGGNGGEGGAPVDECAPGLVTCPGTAKCTTDLDVGHASGNTVTDCGECGVSCSLAHATSAACSNASCEPVCSSGFDDCNAGTANDGCEANLASPASCGACSHVCAMTGVATAMCTDAKCAPTCGAGFLDCNIDDGSKADDGCEVYGDSLLACRATCASSGSPCASNQVCNAGSCVAPDGLVKLSIPFTQAGQVQRYGNRFATYLNLTNSALVVRLHAPGALGGMLYVYATDSSDSSPGPGVRVPLEAYSKGWGDLEIPVGKSSEPFDTASVYQLTIEIESGTGPWLNPTVIYVDSIWSTNALVRDTFETGLGRMVASTFVTVAGSAMNWVAAATP